MARLAISRKRDDDRLFFPFLLLIEVCSSDNRNFVHKAVNWALRQIGKRSMMLNGKCIDVANALMKSDNRYSKWVGKDAAEELVKVEIRRRIKR